MEIREFKQTEIGKIPKEWEVARLAEFVDINKKSTDPPKDSPNDKFLYVDIDSVENGTGVIRNAKEIIGKDAPSRARRVIHHNDVLMSTVRPYLKAFTIVPKKFHNQICSTGFAVLTSRDKIMPLYLFHTLFTKSVIDQCNKMMVGGQYPALSASQVQNIKITLPPLREQKKIAEILSTVDQAIEKVDEAIEKTQRVKRGLMQKLLTKGVGHKEFKKTVIGEIPSQWDVSHLEKVVTSYKNGIYKPNEFYGAGYPCIRMYNIRNGRINPIDAPFLQVTNQELQDYELEAGDILVNRVNTPDLVGKSGVVPYGLGKMTFESKNIRVRLDKTKVFPDFFACYVQTATYLNQIRSRAKTAVAQATITQDDLDSVILPLPPLPEQQKIAEILSTVDARLELLRKRKERLVKIKKGLMDDLLTGKVRITSLISKEDFHERT